MKILGIESSCDETSIAILDDNKICANLIYSQTEHTKYGGVVPEIASRAHLEKIDNLMLAALQETGIAMQEINLIAVTDSPGLAGALLVGVSFALGLHTAWKIPITGVNHLEGHIFSVLLENRDLQFPFLALVASGGHTAIYKVENVGRYECIGQTVDDAAGEAFDKVGKMLHFTYPAGKTIELEAAKVDSCNDIQFPVARCTGNSLDFSFSGLKTSVKYFLAGKTPDYIAEFRPAICKAFQNAVVQSLINNLQTASRKTGLKKIALVGGVACNSRLREELKTVFGENVYYPSPSLCTDNAAMIALAGKKRLECAITRFPHMNPAQGL